MGPLSVIDLLEVARSWVDHLPFFERVLFFFHFFGTFWVAYRLVKGHVSLERVIRRTAVLIAFELAVASLVLGHHMAQQPFRAVLSPPEATALAGDYTTGEPVIPNIVDPEAVDAQTVCPGYAPVVVTETKKGLTAQLALAGKACNVYGTDIHTLNLVVEFQAKDRLHVEIYPDSTTPQNHTWYFLPEELVPKPGIDKDFKGNLRDQSDLDFIWSPVPSFSFNITRKSTGDVLFSTHGTKLVYEDQFIEFSSSMPENYNVAGLGETMHSFRLGNNLTRTLYATDVPDVIDANLYGHHAFYLDSRYFEVDGDDQSLRYAPSATDKSASYKSFVHGVFQRNAHIQEVLLREKRLTWRALGGGIDLYFYSGPSQDEVTKSYQKSMVGFPAMQQYWTFGYHQCRWGYESWAELQDVVDNFYESDIPLETIWSDIDYMQGYRDFDNDPVRYSYEEGAKFLSRLHKNGQHYVPIIDSAVYAPDPEDSSMAYGPFDRGVDQKAFMLNPDGSLYIGKVWPGFTVFPDWIGALFSGTGANEWWISEVVDYYQKINFDGIWVDMNEASTFCVGSCGSNRSDTDSRLIESPTSTSSSPAYRRTTPTPGVRNVNYPPYTPNHYHGDLAVHAVSPNATHHGGYLEYDFHSLFGHQIINATYHSLLSIFPSKRPFIIARSQFAGSGKWAGHWGGDNYSKWIYLYLSIPQALSYSLFGFPMFGVDTCGFIDDSTAELCSRWMQLSAFFPFYRNHNDLKAAPQEPYRWPEVADASRRAMAIRYSLLPYLYTAFYRSHSRGDTVMRALEWEFSDEPWLAGADRQFLLGDALMVVPCLAEGADTVDGVFPGGGGGGEKGVVWYDWYNRTAVPEELTAVRGRNVTLDAPLGHIPLFVRGGNVVPMQEPALTTSEARKTPWSLLVALNGTGAASGQLYLDDGESLVPEETTWVDFNARSSSLTATTTGTFVDTNALGNVTVMGVSGSGGDGEQAAVTDVKFNGEKLGSKHWSFVPENRLLKVQGLDDLTSEGAWSGNWTLSWE